MPSRAARLRPVAATWGLLRGAAWLKEGRGLADRPSSRQATPHYLQTKDSGSADPEGLVESRYSGSVGTNLPRIHARVRCRPSAGGEFRRNFCRAETKTLPSHYLEQVIILLPGHLAHPVP